MNQRQSDINIILTGTIVPNASFTVVSDPSLRRQEYLDAIKYYAKFAPVHFLENSLYDLDCDPDFRLNESVKIRKFPVSSFSQRGKGYQEFEMMDSWISSNLDVPERWLKITGRYLVENISDILTDCHRDERKQLVIDLSKRSKIAHTHMFCSTSDFYRKNLLNSYKECDDESGEWIERVLYKKSEGWGSGATRTFRVEPNIKAVSGSTGGSLAIPTLKRKIKSALRAVNGFFDNQYLWYSN
jgi:hypothetical protein